jgi:hypothetical protein
VRVVILASYHPLNIKSLTASSLINFLSVLYFLALAWHSTSGSSATFPLDKLPSAWNWLYYAAHALAYTLVLFLAGIYGERPRSAKEVVLATQRALEQRALELWRLQKDAEIEGMMRRGEPLGAVAAALASPETAERIAVLEAATSGRMSSLLAARLNVARAGGDLSILDGLHVHQAEQTAPTLNTAIADETSAHETLEVATSDGPFALSGNHRNSQNGSRSRS